MLNISLKKIKENDTYWFNTMYCIFLKSAMSKYQYMKDKCIAKHKKEIIDSLTQIPLA